MYPARKPCILYKAYHGNFGFLLVQMQKIQHDPAHEGFSAVRFYHMLQFLVF